MKYNPFANSTNAGRVNRDTQTFVILADKQTTQQRSIYKQTYKITPQHH
tara:strand:+ start:994 stop:1140 length:147 start_codon:yes stop_codon:yes gene_type:complete